MKIAEAIENLMREAAQIMLKADDIDHKVTEKSGHANFVTEYDKEVEEFLKVRLLALMPGSVFRGEEDEEQPDVTKGLVWIVDPIDGTTNFMRGFQTSAISVALLEDGQVIKGFIYNPYRKEMFAAERGQGATLNGRPIHVSERTVEDGLVIFGTAPYYREELEEATFSMVRAYFDRCLDIRRSGSAAIDLANIACGRAEVFFELRLSPWDYAAGSLLIEEAGGRVTTVDGKPLSFSQPISILASGCLNHQV